MTWSGEELTWEEVLAWLRFAIAETEKRQLSGDPIAQRPALLTQALSRRIIGHFLGDEWFAQNAMLETPECSYFHPVFNIPDGEHQTAGEYSARVFSLAECLFNMQKVESIKYPINAMHDRAQIESTVAELLFGMMLFQEQITFRYIEPSKISGVKTPDIQLEWCGSTATADVKCKYEINEYKTGCLKAPFEAARKQIGKGNQGLILIKTPQAWAIGDSTNILIPNAVIEEIKNLLRQTTRIVKAVFYLFHVSYGDGVLHNRHAVAEINSPCNAEDSPWNANLFEFRHKPQWLRITDMVEQARMSSVS